MAGEEKTEEEKGRTVQTQGSNQSGSENLLKPPHAHRVQKSTATETSLLMQISPRSEKSALFLEIAEISFHLNDDGLPKAE